MSLYIYKASAGSGKTFTLAVEYIKFLMLNPTAYKHILAVTFTNKATTEMKERILQQLYGIWKGDSQSNAYEEEILKRLNAMGKGMEAEALRQRAGEALQNLLHDYSWFRVETIDSFFQEVMRNLARELNLTANLTIEVDANSVLDKAVDRMIENLKADSTELGWIEEYIEERIQQNQKWKIDKAVKEFAQNLFNETFMEHGEKLRKHLAENPRLIEEYKRTLKALQREALDQMKDYGEQFYEVLQQNGLEPSDLMNKEKGVSSYFNKLRNGNLNDDVRNATVEKHLQDADNWCSKTSARKAEIVALAQSTLLPLLQKAENARPGCLLTSNTCALSLQHLNKLRLLNSISQAVQQDNEENNRFLLPYTNDLLHRLIDEGDANFVFEKIGAHLKHVMIDEFQDTSRMQWDNFKLLISNILAEGHDSLIVGDVKQSIYRWRNGDWNILNELGRSRSFGCQMIPVSLDTNRRSEINVVHFNNALFKESPGYFESMKPKEPDEEYQKLRDAYKEVDQLVPDYRPTDSGMVKVLMQQPDDKLSYNEQTISLLGEEVKNLLEQGINPNDITILIRTKKTLPAIAAYFETELQQTVVSDEAFKLCASSVVGILIDALRCLIDPGNKLAWASLKVEYQSLIKPQEEIAWDEIFYERSEAVKLPQGFTERMDLLREMPLYELIEELYNLFDLQVVEDQNAYLFAFFDAVAQYLQEQAADISSFLKFWDEELYKKAIPSGEVNGIRVMSIHASKGLQSHTVLVPFCDWTLEKDKHDILLWSESAQEQPYNQLDIVPMSYNAKLMQQSLYNQEYEHERLQLWVDNLNLLYVAFTRAEKNLIVLSKMPQMNKKGELGDADKVNGLLNAVLPTLAKDGIGSWDEKSGCYQLGELYTLEKKTKAEESVNLLAQAPEKCPVKMVSNKPKILFRQSNRSADFIAGREESDSPTRFIDRGRLMHKVFSVIRTVDDVDKALEELTGEGVISSQQERNDIRQGVLEALQMPQVKDWYNGTWRIFNECDIIWMEHDELKLKRPDRVMMRGNELIVIDFKFGKPNKKYHQQVQGYMNLLKNMGYNDKQISGYLWYVDEKTMERV